MSDEEPKDDSEYVAKLFAKQRAERAARLAAAKQEQHAAGKQPFDLEALEKIYDTSNESGYLGSLENRQQQYEEYYYVTYSHVKTIEEFAKAKAKNDLWRN